MIITLSGEPKSTNNIYKYACRGKFGSYYMSAEGKKIKEDYKKQAKKQWRKQPLQGELDLTINLYFGTKRKSDWDNFHKLSCDALTGIVYVDDNQVQSALVHKHYDKANPRIEIDIMA